MNEQDKKKFVRVRRVGVALVAFIFNTEPAIQFFLESNTLDKTLKKILETKKDLSTSYDRKVYVLGLISLMMHSNVPDAVKIRFTTFISDIAEVLDNQKDREPKEIEKARLKAEKEKDNWDNSSDMEFDSEFTDDSDIESDDSLEDLFEASEKDELRNYISEIKSKDEFLCFKQFILKFKNEQGAIFSQIFSKMNTKSQDYIRKTIQIERVEIGENVTEARRILKIRRKN